jgi:hypothetical protein
MKFVSKLGRLAAAPGSSPEQQRARREVAIEFFAKHIYETGGDWNEARRAMQCFDYTQPVVVGPSPAAPARLVAVGSKPLLQGGFFAEKAPATLAKPVWWTIAPEAPYLKWFLPFVAGSDGSGQAGDARFFVPAVRQGMGILARPA